jgi:cytochrome c biogenesis factor
MDLGSPEGSSVAINIERSGQPSSPGILLIDASMKPWISLVWCGTLIMLFGFGLAVVKRAVEGERT